MLEMQFLCVCVCIGNWWELCKGLVSFCGALSKFCGDKLLWKCGSKELVWKWETLVENTISDLCLEIVLNFTLFVANMSSSSFYPQNMYYQAILMLIRNSLMGLFQLANAEEPRLFFNWEVIGRTMARILLLIGTHNPNCGKWLVLFGKKKIQAKCFLTLEN